MKKIIILLSLLVLATFVSAQTVTVDASNASPDGTTTFNSLQAAIESFQASGDGGTGVNHGNAAADVINVVAGTVVDEAIIVDVEATDASQTVLDEALTIQGSGGQAVIALQMSSLGAIANDCGFVYRQPVDLTLQDLVFIPSLTNTPTDDALYFRQPTDGLSNPVITVDSVVVTSNDGADAPCNNYRP